MTIRPLTPLEISSGLVLPPARRAPALPALEPGATPRAAFEAAILPALGRSPCLVSFSGGRDSSAVLATATFLARREGLPLPVPITHRFPRAGDTQESEWQEQVISHLGIEDWIRIEAAGDLDCVGPVATATLRRHGLLWPCNAYFHAPIFEAAAGGAVVTGVGGDEAFSPSSWARALAVLRGRARPGPRNLAHVGFALSPAAVKRALIRRWLPEICPWLRPAARERIEAQVASDAASEPLRWRTRYRDLADSGYMKISLGSLAVLAAAEEVELAHPFHDRRFLAALAALPPARRPASRSEAMTMLVGDLLPAALLNRSTKARFDQVFWTEHSRELVASWDGEGVDPEIVDLDRLRAEWASPTPEAHTFTLLQSVWLTRARAAGLLPAAATPTPAAG
jgi:asparagine synthetase B (glutamine-hydrolysing)